MLLLCDHIDILKKKVQKFQKWGTFCIRGEESVKEIGEDKIPKLDG